MLLHDCCSDELVEGEGAAKAQPVEINRLVRMIRILLNGVFMMCGIVVPIHLCDDFSVIMHMQCVEFGFLKKKLSHFDGCVRMVAAVSLNILSFSL